MNSPAALDCTTPGSNCAGRGECSWSGKDRAPIEDELFDAVVIGAGPAGAVSAAILAQRGWRVLIVEKSKWPREKVCGGCVNARSVELLESIGLGKVLQRAITLRSAVVADRFSRAILPLRGGVALARGALDAALIDEARTRGATFISEFSASVHPSSIDRGFRFVELQSKNRTTQVRARVVLACDGIGGTSVAREPWAQWSIAGDSWFGVAIEGAALKSIDLGEIHMHVGRGGYVGAVRFADGSTHLAAALDRAICQSIGGPIKHVMSLLQNCNVELTTVTSPRLLGVGLLTRARRTLAGHRVLAVGDACGYVEPFTGEGIAWAIQTAIEATQTIPEIGDAWPADFAVSWRARHRRTIGPRQQVCRLARFALRRPRLSEPLLAAAGFVQHAALPRRNSSTGAFA